MNYIEKYFGHTKPTEILFRNTSTASNLDNMFGSFYYYAKVEAGESDKSLKPAFVM
ncbi:hypothetical protein AAA797_004446 [Vibrio parahaemolyticus]|uniref:hypothetical protein n=1 Tax=Vibrio harveyi group TaxID=717610 RepID=UPI00161651D2|nr:hypothetical protein [Vibrio diabolicus]EIE1195743.1 hypothetical protein [Vibrio parahaemolyticus]EIU6845881.1 hypothetical protein [Vibrio parahaemolyticus]EJC6986932.1 hypothetical protein [Vibrio parahaemolyticus]EJG1901234.1 hypothetical protein [Vibrio parahaemolyticus]EKB1978449.1 hypothetical protein [Vibrio parahaemolyticus]